MLKILIITLLVFCILSFYMKKTKKLLKSALCVSLVVLISLVFNATKETTIMQKNNIYLACGYTSSINQYMDIAQRVADENGIDVGLLFAQGIAEQGLNFNKAKFLFGIKVAGKQTKEACEAASGNESGVTWTGHWYGTKEEVNGKMVSTGSCFRTYSSAEDSMIDYGYWLTHTFKYRDRLKSASTLAEQVSAINGYATSSSYCHSLVTQINACDLGDEHLDEAEVCGKVYNEKEEKEKEKEKEEKGHFSTVFDGYIDEGWLYLRTRAYEDPEEMYYFGPDVMDDAIDEIFYRARIVYTQGLDFGYLNENQEGDSVELEGDNEQLCQDMENVNAGGVNTWRQGGKPWSKIRIGSESGDTLSKWGCFATAIAIQIKRSGVNTGIPNFNPGSFACEMIKHGGFTSGALIIPSKISEFIPGVSNGVNESISATQGNDDALRSRLQDLINDGHYPILWVNGSGSSGHYIAVTEVTADNVKIIDPSGRGDELWPAYTKVSAIRSIKKG